MSAGPSARAALRVARWVALAGASFVASGCQSRYASLRELDEKAVVPATRSGTWIGWDGASTWLLVASGEALESEGSAALAAVARDGSLAADVGAYTWDGTALLALEVAVRLRWAADAETPFLAREGAAREAPFPPIDRGVPLSALADGSLRLGLDDGGAVDLHPLEAALRRLDATRDDDALTAARLLRVVQLVALSRIEGMGSAGIADLVEGPRTVPGFLRGSLRASVSSYVAPDLEVRFDDLEDLTRLRVSGTYRQDTSLSGRGRLGGSLRHVLLDEDDAVVVDARLDLGGVELVQGLPAAGAVALTLAPATEPRTIPVDRWRDLDLSALAEAPPP